MTRARKRELGILRWQIAVAVIVLIRNGNITRGMTHQEIAVIIALHASEAEGTCAAWESVDGGELGGADLQAIMEIILRILAVILPLLLL